MPVPDDILQPGIHPLCQPQRFSAILQDNNAYNKNQLMALKEHSSLLGQHTWHLSHKLLDTEDSSLSTPACHTPDTHECLLHQPRCPNARDLPSYCLEWPLLLKFSPQ